MARPALIICGDDSDNEAKPPKKRGREKARPHLQVAKARGAIDAVPACADVLIVEDDSDCREILHDILIHSGHTVSVAIDRAEALELLERGRKPTLIIMDLMMPNIDTVAFQKRMKELALGHVPIIAISAATEREVPSPKGARARFLKPIDLSRLLKIVGEIASGE